MVMNGIMVFGGGIGVDLVLLVFFIFFVLVIKGWIDSKGLFDIQQFVYILVRGLRELD